ncbi:MAG: recombinase family protein [Alphaproteobacteria bacterium]|nr:recombinase family protein [Alphaproteobacteria bacterium]MBU1515139.1 recombinase family protein [Alphaproteobacteria bacterium]MBU2092269.1 recombinase family protein [Alphaproteobacteria bacterium]MBU2152863.1 recombinase family protein [Alphaproteobacteria bacterium]MBU2305694.1 recombinase family protein [Alphaproteobacteria bacterium]
MPEPISRRAAQYVRMSTEHQRYSIEGQSVSNAAYALSQGYEIVETYRDAGISGLTLAGRAGLNKLLSDILSGDAAFGVVLVYDVSRWGRFQDPDEAGHYEFMCRQAGVRIEYTAEAFANDDSMATSLVKHLKRAMAAEYSRELSVKVSRAKGGLARQGFWCGGPPAYGYRRRMIAPNGDLGQTMEAGERKALQGYRTVLTLGPPEEVATVRRIFKEYVVHGLSVSSITRGLVAEGVLATHGKLWTRGRVWRLLRDGQYAGLRVVGRVSTRLRKRQLQDPSELVQLEDPSLTIISRGLYEIVQMNLNRFRRPTEDLLLEQLRRLLAIHGRLSQRIVNEDPHTCNTTVFRRYFGGLVPAYLRIGYELSNRQLATQTESFRDSRRPWRGVRLTMTEPEILAKLGALLARHGWISATLIDLDGDLPSSWACGARFGGLEKVYKMLGYAPNAKQLGRFRARAMRGRRTIDGRPPLLD